MEKKKVLVLVAFLIFICACTKSIQYQIPPYQGIKPVDKIPLSIGLYFHPVIQGTDLKNTVCYSEGKLFYVACGQITVLKSIQAFNLQFDRVELIESPSVFERIEQIKQRKLDLLVELKLIRHDQLHPNSIWYAKRSKFHAEYEIGVMFFNSEGKIILEGSGNYITQETEFDPLLVTKNSLLSVSDQVSMAVDRCLSKILSNLQSTNLYMSKMRETEKVEKTIMKEQPQESPPSKTVESKEEILTGTGFPIAKDLVVT